MSIKLVFWEKITINKIILNKKVMKIINTTYYAHLLKNIIKKILNYLR